MENNAQVSQPSVLAQTSAPPSVARVYDALGTNPWMAATGILLVGLVGLQVLYQIRHQKMAKKLRFETFKNQELVNKLKLALKTISRMESNPDLVASREFNLDYLRMRMEEEHFNNAIVGQLKAKIKDKVAAALRPKQTDLGVGVAVPGRHVDTILDMEYAPYDRPEERRVLFRIQIKLTKLPTQPTSQTIAQLMDCVEHYLKPDPENEYWQPTVQGRLLTMEWDQKAKPTPLLVLEQNQDGGNVVFNYRRNRT